MICQRCGAENDEGRFCYNCGERLAAADVQTQAAPQPAPAPAQTTYTTPPPAPAAQWQQQPMQVPQYDAAYNQQVAPNSTAAIVSLILGIVAWFALPLLGAIGAVIAGHMARREIRAANGRISGDGLALIGLILGYVQLGLTAVGLVALFMFFLFIIAIA